MTVEQTLAHARARLAALADQRTKEGMQRYFRETITAYGVAAPKVKKLAQEIYREVKPWPPKARNYFCTELFKSGMSEEGALAIYLYRYFTRLCHKCEFKMFEQWVERYVDNWAWCDGISCWLIHASLGNDPSLLAEIPAWTESTNPWKRRAAAVSLVAFARRGLHTEVILDVAGRLRTDTDDMVRKGAGWLLKDAYPKKPREVVEFLTSDEPPFARLVLRIAVEKMTAEHRRLVSGAAPRAAAASHAASGGGPRSRRSSGSCPTT